MKALIFIVALMFSAWTASAQESKSYWAIETNLYTRNYTIVRIYDGGDNLISEDTLKGKYLSVTKRKDKRFLRRYMKNRLKPDLIARNKK